MRFDINLASRPLVNHLPHALLLGTLAAGVVVLGAWNLSLYLTTRSEARAVESQLDELESEERRLESRRAELLSTIEQANLDRLAARVAAANDVLSQRYLSWSLLLKRLQEETPWKLRIESIRTTVSQAEVSVTLNVVTREQESYLLFIDELEASPCFSDVYPESEEREEDGRFSVTLEFEHDPWCGQAPPEILEERRRRTTSGRRRGGRRG